MEVRLSRKDLQILDTGGRAKPSERPFGYVTPFDPLTNSDDIVEVLIHDENQPLGNAFPLNTRLYFTDWIKPEQSKSGPKVPPQRYELLFLAALLVE